MCVTAAKCVRFAAEKRECCKCSNKYDRKSARHIVLQLSVFKIRIQLVYCDQGEWSCGEKWN